MNAERLLEHYERIADAPDAVQRLRRFVLDLAVRGKLAPQDPNDEPIAKRYQKEHGGDDIPANWRILNFGEFCDIEGGNQPPKSQFIDESRKGYVRLLQIRDLGDRPVPVYIPIGSARSLCKQGEILIGRYGASVGKVFWAQDGAYNVAMAKFIWPDDALIPRFAFLLLKSEYLQGPLAAATRSAQAGFNKGDLAPINFPLPPLAEQHRIVAKVDELMALCHRLEAARAEREATRDRLAAASLARLGAPDPETFQADARFALDALPALTMRPDQIKHLRRTILNLAVRGKLVPQDPKDEPASELLKRIAKEKVRLVNLGEIRRDKALSSINADDEVFSLPASWCWCRLRQLASALGDGLHGTPNYSEGSDCYFINGNNLKDGRIVIKPSTKTVSLEEMQKHKKQLTSNSVLVSINGTLGSVAFYNGEKIILGKSACYFNLTDFTDKEFVKVVLDSPYFSNYAVKNATGTTIMNLSLKAMNEFPVPLPPLAEQHRIVAKVDELMALCDRLEASLTATADIRCRLLDALLAEALDPAERELEAAE